jgi:hypothetical protein
MFVVNWMGKLIDRHFYCNVPRLQAEFQMLQKNVCSKLVAGQIDSIMFF